MVEAKAISVSELLETSFSLQSIGEFAVYLIKNDCSGWRFETLLIEKQSKDVPVLSVPNILGYIDIILFFNSCNYCNIFI